MDRLLDFVAKLRELAQLHEERAQRTPDPIWRNRWESASNAVAGVARDLATLLTEHTQPAPESVAAETAALDAVIDCGDNACLFKQPGASGMRTNGGCSCFERAGYSRSTIKAVRQMLPEVLRLRRQVAESVTAESEYQRGVREERERVRIMEMCAVIVEQESRDTPEFAIAGRYLAARIRAIRARAQDAAAQDVPKLTDRERCARLDQECGDYRRHIERAVATLESEGNGQPSRCLDHLRRILHHYDHLHASAAQDVRDEVG